MKAEVKGREMVYNADIVVSGEHMPGRQRPVPTEQRVKVSVNGEYMP